MSETQEQERIKALEAMLDRITDALGVTVRERDDAQRRLADLVRSLSGADDEARARACSHATGAHDQSCDLVAGLERERGVFKSSLDKALWHLGVVSDMAHNAESRRVTWPMIEDQAKKAIAELTKGGAS